MPAVTEPYLPQLEPSRNKTTFTLVLDLDETLIHFIDCDNSLSAREKMKGSLTARTNKTQKSSKRSEDEEFGGHFLIRPGAREFLRQMSKVFEIVIFTAAM